MQAVKTTTRTKNRNKKKPINIDGALHHKTNHLGKYMRVYKD